MAYARKRMLALFMAFVMCVSLLPVNVLASSTDTVELNVGDSALLPGIKNSDNGEHEWSVGDESIVSVDENGMVTGLAAGETVVTHTYYVEKAPSFFEGIFGGGGSSEPESEAPEQGGDVETPDQGGDVETPEQGGDVEAPEQGGDVEAPEQGGDIEAPD